MKKTADQKLIQNITNTITLLEKMSHELGGRLHTTRTDDSDRSLAGHHIGVLIAARDVLHERRAYVLGRAKKERRALTKEPVAPRPASPRLSLNRLDS